MLTGLILHGSQDVNMHRDNKTAFTHNEWAARKEMDELHLFQ